MAKWSFGNVNWTPTATGDAASTLANGTFQAIGGASATQRIQINEVYIAGVAGASSPTFMMLARDSTLGTTLTALAAPAFAGPLDPATAALVAPPLIFTAVTGVSPQRSAATTSARLNLAINAFGGIVRWVEAPNESFVVYGSATTAGEASLSAYTGGAVGAVNTHIVYEPL